MVFRVYINTWEVGRTLNKLETTPLRGFLRLSRVLPTSRMFTSGYVNTETISSINNTRSKTVINNERNNTCKACFQIAFH